MRKKIVFTLGLVCLILNVYLVCADLFLLASTRDMGAMKEKEFQRQLRGYKEDTKNSFDEKYRNVRVSFEKTAKNLETEKKKSAEFLKNTTQLKKN